MTDTRIPEQNFDLRLKRVGDKIEYVLIVDGHAVAQGVWGKSENPPPELKDYLSRFFMLLT